MPVLPTAFSPATVSRLAFANVVANGLIVVTGGAVRLTGSGLGCPTFPTCTEDSLITTPEMGVRGVIEFGNRTLTFLLAAIALAVLVAVWRSPRRDLRPLAVLGFLGIPAQAGLGGITVLTGLNPWTVAAHFLISMALVAIATVLWLRSREPGVGQPLIRRPLVLLVRGIAVVTALVLLLGTLVTGSGPHSGDVDANDVPTGDRMGFDLELISQLHADAVFLLLGLTIALLVALYATDAPGRVRRAARDLLVVQLAQGVIGYVQYFTGLPIVLVLLHMLGAVLIVAYTARLVWAVRGPASDLPLSSSPQPAAAAR
ncbi:COX15/CtaA family protein [Blastococcus montanus]|uniref:COX15/CtaA family protein n=1 Tax=Blastococcus montanus TaxID=3144973 RepID=UPI003208344F